MDFVSISPFQVGSVLWRPRPDRWTLTVVSKATYTLSPGTSALAPEQEPIHERDACWDDDPRRSVHTPSDLAPFKPRADVVLVGHAYAPRSEMVRSLVARLLVGEMEKAIEVFCPRVVGRDGDLREGQRWNKMPIRYEYAAGGLDTWNPVGIGAGAPTDAYGQRPLPNLQPPGLRVTQWRDNFVPTGLGPLSSSWRIRREKLGRRAEGWSDEGWTQIALDDDFDGEFFQVAPPDQQIDALRDDERIVLEYLNPDHPSLTTQLPGVHPHAFVEIPGSPARDLIMTADTLWIDTDRALCTLTWRGQVAVDGPDQPGRVIVALEESGQSLHWAALAARPSSGTLVPEAPRPGMNTLPFVTTGGHVAGDHGSDATASAPAGYPRTGRAAAYPPVPDLPTPPPPDSPDDAVEPVPTPRRRPTLPMAAGGEAPPGPEPAARTAGLRHTLPMFPSPAAESVALPAPAPAPSLDDGGRAPQPPRREGLGLPAVGPTFEEEREPPRAARPPTGGSAPLHAPRSERTQVSIQVGGAPAATRRRSFELLWQAPSLARRLPEIGEPGEDVASVLGRAPAAALSLEGALAGAIAGGGALSPPLVILDGEISFPFDEVEELRTLVTAARPAARSSEALAGLLALADETLRAGLPPSPELAGGLGRSIRDAWAQASPALPARHLAEQVDRALLLRRAYQRRSLIGRRWVRALLSRPSVGPPVPAYLPVAAAERLPLFRRFPAWMVAEVLPPQDELEASPVALRIAALARDVTALA